MERHSYQEIDFLSKMFPYVIQIKVPRSMSTADAIKAADKIDASLSVYSPPIPVRIMDDHFVAFFKEEEVASECYQAIEAAIQEGIKERTILPNRNLWRKKK